MNVSELQGVALDRAVARALGMSADTVRAAGDLPAWSRDWKMGGPLVERYGISLDLDANPPHACVHEHIVLDSEECGPQEFRFPRFGQDGATPLEAAMRSLVASRLGRDVQIDWA